MGSDFPREVLLTLKPRFAAVRGRAVRGRGAYERNVFGDVGALSTDGVDCGVQD